MDIHLAVEDLKLLGINALDADELLQQVKLARKQSTTPKALWQIISQKILTSKPYPFAVHLLLFNSCFPNWHSAPETAPAWIPGQDIAMHANINQLMHENHFQTVNELHQWSTEHFENFWQTMLGKLAIRFHHKPSSICDLSQGVETPHWLPNAKLNIIDSCFNATPHAIAIIDDHTQMTYGELNQLSNRIANSLQQRGFGRGDAIAIIMPLNRYAVAIYLAIIKIGAVVVSIADSFSNEEISTRLKIAQTKLVFTQDLTLWSQKQLPLYEKIISAHAPKTFVLAINGQHLAIPLRAGDISWDDFLGDDNQFTSISCHPMDPCNILFSSGTTAAPKAIPWTHITPIKAASDAFLHHNIKLDDVLCWPTSLGWMMGPWLLFAALINRATIALYSGSPKERGFGEFIQNAKVTMLGVVPTLVAAWRLSGCMEELDWRAIKVFSSTGECSNPDDMLYLMSLANYKPIIEYCGGTEIGGAFVTSTVVQENFPSLFSTPAMGIDFIILDDHGKPTEDIGEIALIPPSIGLSNQLLNADHQHIYFANMPKINGKQLRRHGDQIKKLSNGYYMLLGRVDDTMNLGGIKISAAEIERSLVGIADIAEVAAIAIPTSGGGPSQLIIFAVTALRLTKESIMPIMQKKISSNLNPLFKIHDIVFVTELPKTASNKIMRRELRKRYQG